MEHSRYSLFISTARQTSEHFNENTTRSKSSSQSKLDNSFTL